MYVLLRNLVDQISSCIISCCCYVKEAPSQQYACMLVFVMTLQIESVEVHLLQFSTHASFMGNCHLQPYQVTEIPLKDNLAISTASPSICLFPVQSKKLLLFLTTDFLVQRPYKDLFCFWKGLCAKESCQTMHQSLA